ncbi:hypothetical protein GGD81_003920 [Rhodobium orientis]|uniref:DUF2336 domain-containing protein n=1 Tax=Rhodobium orientis TaxID=34017 RepID=A0A327JNQ4_9HYPH|nr:DUF2336 domain-containing protein [Rhodobium orientis]MBB4304855.1 hypothetical protein [Rhodobium orientis]MBK5949184.1 hypothetical protein [Rhodobium orientis]RAI27355.1 hypothetical protein CH339_10470 [Rhodobium orientis]
MTDVSKNAVLKEYETLAGKAAPDGRRRLLRRLGDLFGAGSLASKATSRDLFADVVGRVLEDVPVKVRTEVARRLAADDQAPRKLVLRLAGDHIVVADPLLRTSVVLTDDDLVRLASEQSVDHLLAISRRATLSKAVTEILVQRGDRAVLHAVTGNNGAEFSEAAFDMLVRCAGNDEVLQENLAGRNDLTATVVEWLRPLLTEELTIRLAKADIAASQEGLDRLVMVTAKRIETELMEVRQTRIDASIMADDIRSGVRDLDSVVESLVRADRALDIALVIEGLSEAEGVDVSRLIFRKESGPIAVLCKDIGLGTKAFMAVARLRERRLKRAAPVTRAEIELYSRMSPEEAHRAIRVLKERRKPEKQAS